MTLRSLQWHWFNLPCWEQTKIILNKIHVQINSQLFQIDIQSLASACWRHRDFHGITNTCRPRRLDMNDNKRDSHFCQTRERTRTEHRHSMGWARRQIWNCATSSIISLLLTASYWRKPDFWLWQDCQKKNRQNFSQTSLLENTTKVNFWVIWNH